MILTIPIRTVSGLNVREHPMVRARRVKKEREAMGYALRCAFGPVPPAPPLVVTLTRIAPSNGVDPFDNLPSSMKGCVDAIAQWLGIDDRRSDAVRYQCAQERGPWGVRVEIAAVTAEAA